ncbi:type VII secretion protein EssB [Ligilactobacillus acidipiscis]|uniref:type VII secretion protein EssB n=1 Tax=Ligilactobacillus acidipiscis TaxID=89059 RepID=UPI0023F807A8|nr:type VII secretion protein EssB [Ligilactobacillus acidipiscis]WEV56428.1 type VII secretion protein EssB [Ligilactobacillus acidipiscis]
MTQVKDISEKYEFLTNEKVVQVTLEPSQYDVSRTEQFGLYLTERQHFLAGKMQEASERQLVVNYTKDPLTTSLADESFKKLPIYERLLLAQKAAFLENYLGTPVSPMIAPENIFIQGDQLLVAHRGFMDAVAPRVENEANYFKEYRALILYMINPDLEYSQLIDGAGTLNTQLSKKIQAAQSFTELDGILHEEAARQQKLRQKSSRTVSKKKYLSFKWGAIVLAVLTVILAVTAGFLGFNKLPAEQRVITAQTQYNSKNYGGVLDTLEKDKPENLPKGAQYIAAVSSVQLDSLSHKQQRALLNNLSQKSSENTLLYWIYLGRGDFKESLNIAKNIGDNQYILHAYTKLYDATKSDDKMSGAKKQKLLHQYDKSINKYLKTLGGKKDGTRKDS